MTDELNEIIRRARKKIGTRSKEEVAAMEREFSRISKASEETKALIAKQDPEAPKQGVFSFLPTEMTRISPFFPLPRNKPRPFQKIEWETSWGRLTVSGETLSVYDETVLLAVLVAMRKARAATFETTRHELCKIMGITPAKQTYRFLWEALDRLTGSKINLEVYEPKRGGKGKKRKTKTRMVNTILSGAVKDEDTGKIQITVNPYFLNMYAEGFLTSLSVEFRARLKGDVTKALYRFLEGQRPAKYQCHLLTLARAINLDLEIPLRKIRSRIREGLRELRKQGYLSRYQVSKTDIVTTWRKPKPQRA